MKSWPQTRARNEMEYMLMIPTYRYTILRVELKKGYGMLSLHMRKRKRAVFSDFLPRASIPYVS